MSTVQVDIWSDIACPWCWVGKRHLEIASGMFDGEVLVTWHAFLLDPRAPSRAERPVDYVGRLAAKYMCTRNQAQAMIDRMAEAGADVGVEFRFDRVIPVKTVDGHRVIALAARQGLQSLAKERLLRAYFAEGHDLSDHAVLAELGADVGLEPDRVMAMLSTDELSDEVRADFQTAARLEVTGVPFFLIQGRLAVPGAQPPEVMVRAFDRALELAPDEPDAAIRGEICSPEGCGIPASH